LPSYTISDLTLNYLAEIDSHTADVFFNMQNVFDAQPRLAPSIVFSEYRALAMAPWRVTI